MFSDLDFSYWQSWLIVVIIGFIYLATIATILWLTVMFYLWIMQDYIERDIRNGKIKWLKMKEEDK